MKFLDNNGLLYFWQKIVNTFVKKEDGMGLSQENYTTAEKEKLTGLKNYTLPTASASTLGGVKVGSGLEINSGVLSATGGGTADAVDWSNVQNKPTTVAGYGITDASVNGQVVKIGANSVTVPTNNNQLTNGAGYQTSSQVQSLITSALGNITSFDYQIVASLPSSGVKGTIYLVSNSGTGNNVYDEYIWVNSKFEKIGTTAVDLSGYVQEDDLVAITNQEIDTIVAS